MNTPLQLLLIDDNPDDRALARRAISADFPDSEFVEVGTAAAFEQHIDGDFDCVITDFQLGWSDGLVVLKRVKEKHPERPVIMFTNTGSEEVCAAGLRTGLSDYILKRRDHFSKLPAAVQTALNLAAARRAIRERDAHVKDLLERERAARADAERATRLKDEFLATVSHELRTPLGAILGWAQVLQMQQIERDEELKAYEIIERSAKAQAKLIDDLLDMSRILSGTLRIDLWPIDVLNVVRSVVDQAQPASMKKSIAISTRFEALPPPVRGDLSRIQQVVSILMDNAIKFTPKHGAIHVSLEKAGSDLQLTVRDNGIGIDSAFLPDIFDRFRQSDSGPSRRHSGLGIGLSVAKSLVEMHGGKIEAFSDGIGTGARFVVSLPVAVMREQEVKEFESFANSRTDYEKLRDLTILVVDDDQDTLDLIQRVLTVYGAQVSTASNATDALAKLAQTTFDILLSDIGMPVEDGFSLITRLRDTECPNREIPASSITAFARSQDRERALLAGFDAHLVKPIEPGELVAVVLSLAKRHRRKEKR